MTEPGPGSHFGPASHLGRRGGPRPSTRGPRPYPELDEGTAASEVAFAALRALVHADDPEAVRRVVATAVGDLGGAIVPARYEPLCALDVDVSLGLGDPALVVVDPLSVASMDLRAVLPALLDDARAVLERMAREVERPATAGTYAADPEDLHRYMELMAVGDVQGARRHTLELLRRGTSPAAVVQQVLVPAQHEVGERWYTGRWTIADEHAATAVADACLACLPVAEHGPSVVLASPDGEWHALPARLAAAQARSARARALGPGLPPDHLARFLEAGEPDLLALSCTMATNLIPAARSIAAAQSVGVPVVAGGRAFGASPHRALALGADGWSATAADLGMILPAPREPGDDVPQEALRADAVADEVLGLALERHAAGASWVRAMSSGDRRRSLDDLRWITRHAAAAHACDDPTVLEDLLRWLDRLLRARGVPDHVLPDGAGYLADALEADTPVVAELVREGAAGLR